MSSSSAQIMTIEAVVISTTVSPATPPPTQNPISNNGVPLTIESGTDSAVFKGIAYPGSNIIILKNGLILHELPSFQDGTFEIPVRNIQPGTYTFGIQAKDNKGLLSSVLTYTIAINSGAITEVKGIVIPPTITTDKSEVREGDTIIFSGRSVPNSDIALSHFARTGITKNTKADSTGAWSVTLQTRGLERGDYNAKARAKVNEVYTLYSSTILFKIGDSNKMRKAGGLLVNARCDLNNDSRVNLLDFSIMAFWYKRLGFPIRVDLNSDGRINLTDLSILAYCWTG